MNRKFYIINSSRKKGDNMYKYLFVSVVLSLALAVSSHPVWGSSKGNGNKNSKGNNSVSSQKKSGSKKNIKSSQSNKLKNKNKKLSPLLTDSHSDNKSTGTDTIPTTSEASTQSSSSEEFRVPKPEVVKKSTEKRTPKHKSSFKKLTGYDSASQYMKSEKMSMDKPEIGHIQGYQNHPKKADTKKNNLAVISKTANLLMNRHDNKLKTGDVDSNYAITKEDTHIANTFVQCMGNPSNLDYQLTPSITIDSNAKKLNKQENEEFKKKLERLHDPKRLEKMKKAQEKDPNAFYTTEQTQELVRNKIKKNKKLGKHKSVNVFKFKDQSRDNPVRAPSKSDPVKPKKKSSKKKQDDDD